MTILQLPPQAGPPANTLRRLESTVMWLWSNEPNCELEHREQLLARLGDASLSIDRLVFQQEFHTDGPPDVAQIAACEAEIDDLAGRWAA